MITEDYVSFETAKLLKEKGFDADIDLWYNFAFVQCPTLQMTMKWLMEVHNLFIRCEPRLSFTDFYWITANIYRVRKKSSLYHTEDVDDYHCVASCDSHSYEGACEEAIKYCLENLI